MLKYLILALTISKLLSCDPISQSSYMGSCMEKTCINDKLNRIKLIPYDWNSDLSELNLGITYRVDPERTDGLLRYRVTLMYSDQQNNPIANDPINCIDWRLYQINNAHDIDPRRRNEPFAGATPSWPQTLQSYDIRWQSQVIVFYITHDELNQRGFLWFRHGPSVQWECNFEFAFVVKGVTQQSFYLNFRITNNDPPTVEFNRIVWVQRCSEAGCNVGVFLPTELWFCRDQHCQSNELSDRPFTQLSPNIEFYVLHRVDNQAIGYFMYTTRIVFQSFGLRRQLDENEMTVVQRNRGWNIYRLRALVPSEDLMISVFTQLSDDGISVLPNQSGVGSRRIVQVFGQEPQDTVQTNTQGLVIGQQQMNNIPHPVQQSEELAKRLGCDLTNNLIYQKQCIPKWCLNHKLSRMQLVPSNPDNSNVGQLTNRITYNVIPISTDTGYNFQVSIQYGDQESNQLVSHPNDCIDWRVYQVRNSFDVDSSRLNVLTEGGQPTWPVAQYSFSQQIAQIRFIITQQDLEERGCQRFSSQGVYQWECFFELAFVIKGVTQVSYFMSTRLTLNTAISTQAVPKVEFVRLIQVDRCPPDGSSGNRMQCKVDVNISSRLLFCRTATCEEVNESPFFTLFLNRPFYMVHRIEDISFRSWFINQVQLTYQSFGFKMVLGPNEFQQLRKQAGRNIYQVIVPIVAENVRITATGVLSQTQGRRALVEGDGEEGILGDELNEEGIIYDLDTVGDQDKYEMNDKQNDQKDPVEKILKSAPSKDIGPVIQEEEQRLPVNVQDQNSSYVMGVVIAVVVLVL